MGTLHSLPRPAAPAAASMHPDCLADRLHAGARGDPGTEAAVALLVNHDCWTRQQAFLEACTFGAPDAYGDTPFVWINWATAVDHAETVDCSASARAVLQVAADLAGAGQRTSLRDAFAALDPHAARLTLQALCHVIDLGGVDGRIWCEACQAALPARAHTDHTHTYRDAACVGLGEVA